MLSALPPARRRLLLGVVAVVVVAVLLAVVLVVLQRVGRPAAAAPVRQDVPGPVLLVPGYGGATTALDALAARLRAAGRDATVVRLPGDGTGELTDQATVLDKAARAELAAGAPSVDVIGYSAGGVVARLWAEQEGGAAVARRIVTLGSPHHGTSIAALGASLLPGQCPTACQELVPNSVLLNRLNTDETPAGPVWVSLWTTQDQVVDPPDSARLDGALNIPVQSVCADAQLDHGQLPTDRLVQALVLSVLGPAAPTQPTPADCSTLRA
ncbi:MAG TPA: alpha/beta fold hydrolase [Mycobacteriales bacterium]|jgi:triacylglycerol lipase|nr:alpha/beta fold hydrolase [Mycobacteriales bacterium]